MPPDVFYDPKIIKKPHTEKIKDHWNSDIHLFFPDQGTFTKNCIQFYKLKEKEFYYIRILIKHFHKKLIYMISLKAKKLS